MVSFILLSASAHATNLYYEVDPFKPWGVGVHGGGVCQLATYGLSDVTISGGAGFYVDFFKGRAAAPSLGEIGDWYFFVEPGVGVWNKDGRAFGQVSPDQWYLSGAGEVRFSGNRINVYPIVSSSSTSVWWDVLLNGDITITETNYGDNHAETFSTCL